MIRAIRRLAKVARELKNQNEMAKILTSILKTIIAPKLKYPENFGRFFASSFSVHDSFAGVKPTLEITVNKTTDPNIYRGTILIESGHKKVNSSIACQMIFTHNPDRDTISVDARYLLKKDDNTTILKADKTKPMHLTSINRDSISTIGSIISEITDAALALRV